MIDFLIDNWFWFLIFSGTISSVISNMWKELCKVFERRSYKWEELKEMGYSPSSPPSNSKPPGYQQQRRKPSPKTDWEKYRINKVGGGSGKSYDIDAMEADLRTEEDSYNAKEEMDYLYSDDGRGGVDPKSVINTNQLKKGNVGTANLKEW